MLVMVAHTLKEVGGFSIFIYEVFRSFRKAKKIRSAIIEQVGYVSYRSLPTVIFAGIFVGAILVLQFNLMLAKYEAQSLLGGLNTAAIIREVGPLIISFLLAGKIGAFTAAELGTMKVTEQMDAIRCLGRNPMEYLIVPRFFGIVFSSVILLVIGLVISIGGSMLVADLFCGINPLQYMSTISKFTNNWTLLSGFLKSLIYGTIVAGVACYRGYTATGGAKGVGRAVTLTAVYINLYIVIANYLTSNFVYFLQDHFSPAFQFLWKWSESFLFRWMGP